jgi:prepilin peptidase CpaA
MTRSRTRPARNDAAASEAAAAPVSWGASWGFGLSAAAVTASAIQVASGQATRGFFLITLCFVACSVAACFDVATRRIPNHLTYPAIVLGLVLNALVPALAASPDAVAVVWLGATGPRDGLLGFGLCAAIGVTSYLARGLGGGDVKLLGAVGALLGFAAVVPVLFNTLIVAAVIGVANWALQGTLIARLQIVASHLLVVAVTKRGLGQVYPFARSEAPFALALLIGLVLAQFVALHRIVLRFVM